MIEDGACGQISKEPGRPIQAEEGLTFSSCDGKRITGGVRGWESERLIVAKKPGNAGGAKNAESEARRTAWRKRPLRKTDSIRKLRQKLGHACAASSNR